MKSYNRSGKFRLEHLEEMTSEQLMKLRGFYYINIISDYGISISKIIKILEVYGDHDYGRAPHLNGYMCKKCGHTMTTDGKSLYNWNGQISDYVYEGKSFLKDVIMLDLNNIDTCNEYLVRDVLE